VSTPPSVPIALGLIAGLANVLGGLLVTSYPRFSALYVKHFIAIGAGFMLAAAFLKMVPESLRGSPAHGPMLVLAGYLMVHLFEHSLVGHFHWGEETHSDEMAADAAQAYTVLFGLMLHTFFDGVSIAAGFAVRPSLGILLFLAVVLHKLPEGVTAASLMIARGQGPRAATLAAAAVGVATMAGAASISLWLAERFSAGLAVSAGVTIYVAASDLIPIVNQERGVKMALAVFLGVLFFGVTEHVLEELGL
jgi:ZIP family zinc transporter/zinc and cadmium transporter